MDKSLAQTSPAPAVFQFLESHKLALHRRVARLLQERVEVKGQSNDLAIEEVLTCVSIAYDELLKEANEAAQLPEPDADTVRAALADFDAGRWKPIEDVIAEL